jgi:uncharacterized OsmC-like protein
MANYHQLVLHRQKPLRERYLSKPEDARITSRARTLSGAAMDPFHAAVLAGGREETPWRVGSHRAIGGFHDLPTPGDMLCAALASSFGMTLRLTAARLGVPIQDFEVRVSGTLDARGTLELDPRAPVGFQELTCRVRWRSADATDEQVARLTAEAERACVVLQTLRRGVAVALDLNNGKDEACDAPDASESQT